MLPCRDVLCCVNKMKMSRVSDCSFFWMSHYSALLCGCNKRCDLSQREVTHSVLHSKLFISAMSAALHLFHIVIFFYLNIETGC